MRGVVAAWAFVSLSPFLAANEAKRKGERDTKEPKQAAPRTPARAPAEDSSPTIASRERHRPLCRYIACSHRIALTSLSTDSAAQNSKENGRVKPLYLDGFGNFLKLFFTP